MKSQVYFTKEINSNSLMKIYAALSRDLLGKVAVKISSGELGGHNYLNPALIKDLITKLNGTIVECNTAYSGKREDSKEHWETIKAHGFLDIAPCDIMDEEDELELPVSVNGHLKGINYVGNHLTNYDSMLVLSHFKGHLMGGFGGTLKNISIGIASREGKAWIHSAGKTKNPSECWTLKTEQDDFLESMAEADLSVIEHFKKENMVYINVANNLSIDCDCDSNPSAPEIPDIGIFASLDPVALDKSCYDYIMNLTDPHADSLKERMISRHAVHILEKAEELNIGKTEYEIINIDEVNE